MQAGLGLAGSATSSGLYGEAPPPFTEKDALALLKKNGTFDKLRLQIKEQLQSSVCNLNFYVILVFSVKFFYTFLFLIKLIINEY